MYWTQHQIASDTDLRLRVAACAAEQGCTIVGIDPDAWATEWRRVWAGSPGWDDAWEYAEAAQIPLAERGRSAGVITDQMILAQVQAMMPFRRLNFGAGV